MLGLIAEMWDEQDRLDTKAGALRKAGLADQGEAHAMAAEAVQARIHALDELARTLRPATLADAVVHLLLLHTNIHGRCHYHEDPDIKVITRMVSNATYALAVIAKACNYDLARLGRDYLLDDDALIIRGEVPA